LKETCTLNKEIVATTKFPLGLLVAVEACKEVLSSLIFGPIPVMLDESH